MPGLFDFPNRPGGSLQELWTAVIKLVDELKPGAKAFVIKDQPISSTGAQAIVHGLRGAPSFVGITPRNAAVMWMPREPDSRYIYVQAGASPSTADILVVP